MGSAVGPKDWVSRTGNRTQSWVLGVGGVKGEKPTAQLLRCHNQMGDIGQATKSPRIELGSLGHNGTLLDRFSLPR